MSCLDLNVLFQTYIAKLGLGTVVLNYLYIWLPGLSTLAIIFWGLHWRSVQVYSAESTWSLGVFFLTKTICRIHLWRNTEQSVEKHYTEQSVENSKLTINRIKTLPLGFSPYLTTSNPLRKIHVFNYTVSALSCLND